MGPRSQCHLTAGCSERSATRPAECVKRMSKPRTTEELHPILSQTLYIHAGAYVELLYAFAGHPLRHRSWQIWPSGENVS
jgi:hypothetical protein